MATATLTWRGNLEPIFLSAGKVDAAVTPVRISTETSDFLTVLVPFPRKIHGEYLD
jgi:hypothetical protein